MEALGILENNTAFIICDEAQVPGAVAFVAGKLHAAYCYLTFLPRQGYLLKLPRNCNHSVLAQSGKSCGQLPPRWA